MTPRRITTRARRLLDVPVWPFASFALGFVIFWAFTRCTAKKSSHFLQKELSMEITMDELRSLIASQNTPPNATPFEVGRAYMVRTVTMHLTGRVKAIVGQFLVLSEAAWIADSGRYHKSLKEGVVDECEPFVEDAIVGLGAIVDATPWTGELPRKVK